MKVKILDYIDFWQSAKNSTMNTVGKDKGKYPDSEWKRRLLLSEHSPIRKIHISWKWKGLKSWVSVHFTRHKIGIDHFVSTQRTDRTGINRDIEPQGALVNHEVDANAQAIITISRKRLCTGASKETREAWKEFLFELKEVEPELVKCCVKDCIYRGYCYEFMSCNHHKTAEFQEELKAYREGINL